MDVSVSAGQDDMPAGMAKVLEILNQSIDTIDTKGELSVSEQNVQLIEGKGSTYVTYRNPDGYYEPKTVKVYGYTPGQTNPKGSEASDCNVLRDDVGALCEFSKAGYFLIEADQSQAVVYVR